MSGRTNSTGKPAHGQAGLAQYVRIWYNWVKGLFSRNQETPMSVTLSDFSYYFSVTGNEGGLFSVKVEFAIPVNRNDQKAAMSAARELMDRHTTLFDRVFSKIVTGDRKPKMVDSPGSMNVGYVYESSWDSKLPELNASDLAQQLVSVYGVTDPDMRGEPIKGRKSVHIELDARKTDNRYHNPSVNVTHELNHSLNTCYFHFLKSIDGIAVSQRARNYMDSLERTLAMHWEEQDRDHYKSVIHQD